MTALAASYDARRQEGRLVAYKLAAGAKIYKGALVCVTTSTGLAQTGADAAGVVFVGVAYETADNSGGIAGAKSVRVSKSGEFTYAKAGAAQANVGQTAFVADDNTVSTAATTNSVACGVVTGVVSPALVQIRIDGKVS